MQEVERAGQINKSRRVRRAGSGVERVGAYELIAPPPLPARMIGQFGQRFPVLFAILLLTVSVLAGGGGKLFPIAEIIVESVALVTMAVAIWQLAHSGRIAGATLPFVILGLLALLIAVQLFPIPKSAWAALPGRGLSNQIFVLNGQMSPYLSLSLDREATIRSALALLPAIAMFLIVLSVPVLDRLLLLNILIVLGVSSLVMGALQVSTRSASLYLFSTQHQGNPVGFFSNRNHQATFLLCCIAFAGALIPTSRLRIQPAMRQLIGMFLVSAFTVGVIATPSRMGSFLLPIAWIAYAIPTMRFEGRQVRYGIMAAAIILGALAIAQNGVVRYTLGRFGNFSDGRYLIWRDTQWVIGQYFPFGSGLGTFEKVYAAAEPLATVGDLYVNHAHNDYLEILLETGVVGPAIFGLFLLFLVLSALRLMRMPSRQEFVLALAALASILLMLAHSLVDYPLRTLTMLCIMGMACGFLLPAPTGYSRPTTVIT